MKRLLPAALALVLLCGCSDKSGSGSQTETSAEATAPSPAVTSATPDAAPASTESDPITAAAEVFSQYLVYANHDFSMSMFELMTPTMREQYNSTLKSAAGDHGNVQPTGNVTTDVSFSPETEASSVIGRINIPEEHLRCVELVGKINYRYLGTKTESDGYALVIETPEHEWKLAFAGTKQLAYLNGYISDDDSKQAEANAKLVFETAVKVKSALKDHEFRFMNYLSTEKDEFVEEIKKELPEELKGSYFMIFLENGEVSRVMWAAKSDGLTMQYSISPAVSEKKTDQ